jgi:hypothetical protein
VKLINKRVTAFGAAGALVAGTMFSGALIAPANAADSSYTCQGTTGPLGDIPVSAVSPFGVLPVPSGSTVPAEAFAMTATVPVDILGVVVALVPGATTLGANLQQASMTLVPQAGGTSKSVPLSGLTAPSTPFTLAAPLELPITGSTTSFVAPAPGVYDVKLPASFGFVPIANGAPIPGIPALPCALSAGQTGVIGTMTVTEPVAKEASTTTVRLKNAPITTAKRARLAVTVKQADGDPATGKVLAKEGSKVLVKATSLSDLGKKTLRLPKLKRGKHTVKVIYKGNATTKASSKSITFRVRRA